MNLNDLFNEEKVRLDPKCWTGKKIGNPKTKMKGGVRVNNCVPAESVNEMDKSQTPPGRDGSNDLDASKKEYTAKATTAKKVAKDGEKILNKELNKKQGVAEATGDQKFDSMMGQITGGATARQSVDSLNKSLTARTGSDPETALAKWGQEFINWLEKICRNFERQGVDRFKKLEKVGNLDDGGETMAHWLIEVAKQSNTSGITQADIQEFSSEFNTHGMWAWHQFPIAWGLKEWQDYKDQWTGPDGYMANLGQGMAEGLAQDEAQEDGGWRAEFVNEINYNTFEVKLTNSRSKESANFIVRPVDMVSYGPTLSIETMDVHDLQTGQTESWTNDDPAPDGPIAYAISGLFYDDKQLQKKLQNIIDTHDTKGQDMMPGLEKRRSIGQEVDADAYIDSQEKTQAAMAKMKKGVAEKLGDNRPKLGNKRDAGKSVRKWRSAHGLDETGVAEGDLDEGWKEKLGGAALAGAIALGAGGANARVMPGDDPSINRLTGKPIATQQATDTAPTQSTSSFSIVKPQAQYDVDTQTLTYKGKQYKWNSDARATGQGEVVTAPSMAVGSRSMGSTKVELNPNGTYTKVPANESQEKVGDMDADKFDAAMARLKQLAGAGPLKTVYDPQKRVYRNVPTAVQPKK